MVQIVPAESCDCGAAEKCVPRSLESRRPIKYPSLAFRLLAPARDDAGDLVDLPAAPCQILSLAPGTTAMLYSVGAGGCLVGTIAHSDEPDEAAAVTVVGDAETLDFEQVLALRPTVIVVAVYVVQRVRIERLRARLAGILEW
jgi:ABC-type hemin transport system substrate-binding protein